MIRTRSALFLGFAVLSFASCRVFDESLLNETGEQLSDLGEDCIGDDVREFQSQNIFVPADTTLLTNDRHELSCVGGSARGNDGFFKVKMTRGKKWHFHVKIPADSSIDPAVYVLDSGCQDSVCQRGWGLNECVSGQDEHFSFFPPRDGTFLVGVDSVERGGDALEVLAVEPTCGANGKEHSETCDDDNTDAGDGCDELCRAELTESDTVEKEPNDEPLANANVLVMDPGTSLEVTGQLGGKCDFDSFQVMVPDGGAVRAAMRPSGGGSDCGVALRLQLVDSGGTPRKTLETEEGECPAFAEDDEDVAGLNEGAYYVRVAAIAPNEPGLIDYALEIGAVPAP
jgi:cysteine-rich repeat protein